MKDVVIQTLHDLINDDRPRENIILKAYINGEIGSLRRKYHDIEKEYSEKLKLKREVSAYFENPTDVRRNGILAVIEFINKNYK